MSATPPVTVKIIRTRRDPSSDRTRPGKYDLTVWYQVAGQPVDFVRVPLESATDATITAAIKSHVTERAQWVGKELKL